MSRIVSKPAPAVAPQAPASSPDKPVHTITYGNVRGKIWKQGNDPFLVTLERFERGKTTDEVILQTFASIHLKHLVRVTDDCQKWVQWQENRLAQSVHNIR